MEQSISRDLLNSISHFNYLFSSRNVKSGPGQMYYENLGVLLTLFGQVIEEVVHSEMPSDENLHGRLKELCMYVDDSVKLVRRLQPMMSKIYHLLKIEALTEKIRVSAQEICGILSSSALSTSLASKIVCVQKHDFISQNQMSSVLREAIKVERGSISPSSETFVKIVDSLSLSSNQELLVEAMALGKEKLEAEHENRTLEVELIDQVIGLITHMCDCIVKIKQSQTFDGVPIPTDFCCPLSLELMSDPVIVATGQTYERAFIRKWLDLGLVVCPKTRQPLVHTNLISNINVKALIETWCELNNVKLPDPSDAAKLNQLSTLLVHTEHFTLGPSPKVSELATFRFSNENTLVAYPIEKSSQSGPHGFPNETTSIASLGVQNGSEEGATAFSVINEDVTVDSDGFIATFGHPTSVPDEKYCLQGASVDEEGEGHDPGTTVPGGISINRVQPEARNAIDMSNDTTSDDRSTYGGVMSECPASGPMLDIQTRNWPLQGMSSGRNFVVTSSPALDSRSNRSDIEAEVRKLVGDLQSASQEIQRSAAIGLRLLTRHSIEIRIIIANCGAIDLLVKLLYSTDVKTQVNAVTALLNLSLNDNNKTVIADAGAVEPLIHVLRTGSAEAKENSAATLFSLSMIGENKIKVGRSGGVQPLVDLLGNGTPIGKRDAANALYYLSTCHENKLRIVEAGAVRTLIELMDPTVGMVDKVVAVLHNLSTIPEGCIAIGQDGGIPVLVQVVELGSSRGKERAVAALLQLCNSSRKFSNMVLQQGAVPPVVALTQFGTARAKEKAQLLLSLFKSQRHGHPRRAGFV